jgi:predicted DNA-binding transcriptional regulator YafY
VGTAASGVLPRSASRDTLALLQSAMEAGSPLWIGYLNQQGQASNRIVEPIRLAGGYLTAFDHRHDEVRTFAIHRITGVATVELDDADVPG